MAAVAETAGSRRDMIMGNWRVVSATLTSVDDTDTWTPGLSIIEQMIITNEDAAAPAVAIGATWTTPANRQAVVTFGVESGSQSVRATVIGS
mgnify:CR=1 FL=1